ncbi:MAG: cytochrome c3 family protein, partial [Anaerolineales bacterium]|nr:cytochrome c3 family protein [Anaerolineales bacterium]
MGYTYAAEDTAPLEVYVYAMVLNEQGTIMKGKEGQLTGYVSDYKRLEPGDASGHHIENFGETVFGNKSLTFVDDGSINGDTAGDGVYTAKVTLDKTKGATLVADHMVMNVSVSLPGYTSSIPQQVLISGFYCMSGKQSGGGHAQHTSQSGLSANCAVCHHGYEHWYENISGTFSDDQLDIHALKVSAPTVPQSNQSNSFDSNRWNYSDDGAPANTYPTFREQVPGSQYCSFCHQVPGTALYDYGGGDRSDSSDRPMCNNAACHDTTPISGTTVPAWSPAAVAGSDSTITRANYNISLAQQHAHDDEGANTVACATCHRPQHSLELPNRTSTDYTDLSGRCLSCHTTFNKHNNSVSCINCHTNDTHNIRFLQQDLSYNWSRSNIVTCDNCHTNLSFAGALGLSPPQVPYTNHSTDSMSGQKWGDYWTSVDQQAAAGGSNTINTGVYTVSSELSLIGTTDGISGAQTEDGSYETLTEGWADVIDDYTYVDSSSAVFGTVSNLANAQSASDSNAYATFTEVTSGAGTDDYFGTVVVDSATDPNNAEVIDGQIATVAGSSGYVTTGSWNNPNGAGVITSVKIFVRANGTGSAKDDLELSYNLGSGTYDPMSGSGLPSGALVNYSFDITSDYGGTWDWTVINNLQATATVGTNGGTAYVDALWIQ